MSGWVKNLLGKTENTAKEESGMTNSMRYRLLGNCGLRVSELCLGTMTFGTEWGWGADKNISRQIFDAFVEAGGNFFDTANRYTNGTSEQWLGEFVKSDRHRHVVSTKYSLKDRQGDLNFSGNHRKNMVRSVEESLKRLNTEYIDLLWLHSWDFTTDVQEVMRALDDLVSSGKVLHIGVSNTPAWKIAQANTLAEWRGFNKFVAIQVEYSLIQRAPERDLIPMAVDLGLSVTSWGSLGNGVLTGKYLSGSTGRLPENSPRFTERNNHIAGAVRTAAETLGIPASQIALAWVMQQKGGVIPVVGVRSVEQLRDNMKSVLTLPPDVLQMLHDASALELGYPHDLLASPGSRNDLYAGRYDDLLF
jgi:aryl-alcohol dehydrogenase-like predicted oxidoreductase